MHDGKRLRYALVALALIDAADLQAIGDILGDVQMGPERVILEDHPTIPVVGCNTVHKPVAKPQFPSIGLIESRQGAEERGLSATGRTKQKEQLVGFNSQIHAEEGNGATEALAQLSNGDIHSFSATVSSG